MFDLLNHISFWENTGAQWLTALGLGVLSIIVGRMVNRFLGRLIKFWTRKMETELNDDFINILKSPLITMLILTGIR